MAGEAKIDIPRKSGAWRGYLQMACFVLAFVALVWISRDLLAWMAFVFREPREDMGHGWIVPLFSLAIVWMRRKELSAARGKPSLLGFAALIPGILLFWVGTRGDQVRITQIAMFWILWSMTYAVFGLKFAKLMLFPVVFLLFTVPLSFLDIFTVKLRFLTSALAAGLLNGIGIPVVRTGTGLQCLAGEGFNLDVADPCSGLRSIFALSALTAAYAYIAQRTLLKKWLLFICAVPIAVLGNLMRIFSIAVVAKFFGQEVATGFYHDYSGYVVFLVGILAVMQVSVWFAHGDKKKASDAEPPAPPAENTPVAFGWLSSAILVLVPCLIFFTGSYIGNMPPPAEEPADFITAVLPPLEHYRVTYPWFCQNEQCGYVVETESPFEKPAACKNCGTKMDAVSFAELKVLPADTGFRKCNYYDPMGDVYRITVIINGKSRQSIHRPEVCLPAQGFSMENGHVESFRIGGGDSLAVRCVDLRRRDFSSSFRMGQGYFFISADTRVSSHLSRILISIRDRAFHNKITRWAMVTVFCEESLTSTPERREAVSAFLTEFYPALTPGKSLSAEKTAVPND